MPDLFCVGVWAGLYVGAMVGVWVVGGGVCVCVCVLKVLSFLTL